MTLEKIDLDEFAADIAPTLIDRHWADLTRVIAELRASRKVIELSACPKCYQRLEPRQLSGFERGSTLRWCEHPYHAALAEVEGYVRSVGWTPPPL